MQTLWEHIDMIQLLLAVVAFFLVRTLNKIDKNQGLMFSRLEKLESRFSRLLGAHETNHGHPLRRHDNLGE